MFVVFACFFKGKSEMKTEEEKERKWWSVRVRVRVSLILILILTLTLNFYYYYEERRTNALKVLLGELMEERLEKKKPKRWGSSRQ